MSNKLTTPTEKFLMEVILKTKNKPEVDWPAVQLATGYKSVGGTRNKWSYLKQEYLKENPGADVLDDTDAVKTPKKAGKRKAGEDQDDEETEPAKKTPKTPRSNKKTKVEKRAAKEDSNDLATTTTAADDEL